MSKLSVFNFGDQKVRVHGLDGRTWWVAVDVCKALGLENSRQAVSVLEEDEKDLIKGETFGGNQKLIVVSESGLYALIFKSRKPEAKVFRKWVTSEVLPAIRKTGEYALEGVVKRTESLVDRLDSASKNARLAMVQLSAGEISIYRASAVCELLKAQTDAVRVLMELIATTESKLQRVRLKESGV